MIFHGTFYLLSEIYPTLINSFSEDDILNILSIYTLFSAFIFINTLSKNTAKLKI